MIQTLHCFKTTHFTSKHRGFVVFHLCEASAEWKKDISDTIYIKAALCGGWRDNIKSKYRVYEDLYVQTIFRFMIVC